MDGKIWMTTKRHINVIGAVVVLSVARFFFVSLPAFATTWNDLLMAACPVSAAEWDRYLEKLSGLEKLHENDYQGRHLKLIQHIQSCQEHSRQAVSVETAQSKQQQACVDHVLNYLEAVRISGSTVNNAEYATIPDELLDPGFLRDVVNPEKGQEAFAYIKKLNQDRPEEMKMHFFEFAASIEALGDSKSIRRIMVYVPGNPRRFIAYVVATPQEMRDLRRSAGSVSSRPIEPSNISVIAVAREPDGTYSTHYNDHTITNMNEPNNPIQNWIRRSHYARTEGVSCNSCHLGKPIPVFDVAPKYLEAANFVKQAMLEPVYTRAPNLEHLGPPLGPVRERSMEFLEACIRKSSAFKLHAYRFPESAEQTVRNLSSSLGPQMECARCHNGSPTANGYLSTANLLQNRKLFQHHLRSGNMPRNIKFPKVPTALESWNQDDKEKFMDPQLGSMLERDVLRECLLIEAEQLQRDWPKAVSCTNPVAQTMDQISGTKLGAMVSTTGAQEESLASPKRSTPSAASGGETNKAPFPSGGVESAD